LLVSLAALAVASPASAQVGAVISAFSDARFRGVSVSGGNPVAMVDLSHDNPGGAYFAASGTAVFTADEVKPLSLQLNAGYAKDLRPGLTFDVGVLQSNYSRYSTTIHGSSYTEVYAGLTRKTLTARLHLSPHYFEAGAWTVYGELDHSLSLTRRLSLNSHVGVLAPIRGRGDTRGQVDWRIGLDRQIGRFALHAAFTGARGVRSYEGRHARSSSALVFGASLVL
jgi:uncharacterized protein (TIGR02001 family)